MNILITTCLLALLTMSFAHASDDCSSIDQGLIVCPFMETPKRPDLREGWVSVWFVVNTDGSIDDVSVKASDPHGHWNDAAIKAIEQWRYIERPEQAVKLHKFIVEDGTTEE